MATSASPRFLFLLAMSAALHGAILAGVGNRPARDSRDPLAVLTASLRLPLPPVSGLREDAPRAEPPAASRGTRSYSPLRESRPAPVATAAPPASADAVRAAPAAAAVVPQPPAVQASEAVSAPVPVRDQAAILDGYGHRLSQLFARQQEYPRLAAQRGWEGEVRLRLKVARKGNLVAVEVDRSSGYDILDQHALQLVQQLPALPPLPEGLEAGEVQVVVPVSYRLRKPA